MSAPVSPADFAISGTTPDGLAAFQYFILRIAFLTIYIKRGTTLALRQTIAIQCTLKTFSVFKTFMTTFPSYFLIFT